MLATVASPARQISAKSKVESYGQNPVT